MKPESTLKNTRKQTKLLRTFFGAGHMFANLTENESKRGGGGGWSTTLTYTVAPILDDSCFETLMFYKMPL